MRPRDFESTQLRWIPQRWSGYGLRSRNLRMASCGSPLMNLALSLFRRLQRAVKTRLRLLAEPPLGESDAGWPERRKIGGER
jgi:hypothetical protein